MPKLTVAITTKFSTAESEQLRAKAEAAGVPLRTYIRRAVVAHTEVSSDTALVLAETGRIRELTTRIWTAAAAGELTPGTVDEIAAQVEAIDGRVLTARAKGMAK